MHAVNFIAVLSSAVVNMNECVIDGTSCIRSMVYVGSKAKCFISHSRLSTAHESSVSCTSGGTVVIKHSAIERCGRSGVHANGAAAVIIVCSSISSNGANGVECYSCLTGQRVSLDNQWPELSRDQLTCGVTILNTSISKNSGGGCLFGNSSCSVCDSTISDNFLANISLLDSSQLLLQQSSITGSGRSGLFCRGQHSRVFPEDCYFARNHLLDVESI